MAKKRAQSDDEVDETRSPTADRCGAPPPRPVIEAISPVVDGGRFAAKAATGEVVRVEADVFADGHDLVHCRLRYRSAVDDRWESLAMERLPDDRWGGAFPVAQLGEHRFQIHADIDRLGTWGRQLRARTEAGWDVAVERRVGAQLIAEYARHAEGADRRLLEDAARSLLEGEEVVLDEAAHAAALRTALPDSGTDSPECRVWVDRKRAVAGNWYELFPRSASPDRSRPGDLRDVVDRLPYLERLGIDVLYLPPVHPIGSTNRKGRDGVPTAGPDDPGSPWAIGGDGGGHTAVDPALGTLEDFDRLVGACRRHGIELAMDLAFQCSPDHPWVTEHPGWFKHLPDGSIRFAENPPKRYEDIFPLEFECDEWSALWNELLAVVRFWIDRGVEIFRVDNPHTKPFPFWEWLIASVRVDHPEVVFLAEAFTRPTVMRRLAKIGFSQSYTYFAWRSEKWELESYLEELVHTDVAHYFRPSFWPNTPDILTAQLRDSGTAGFVSRLVLAATLAATYGIYGPAFELMESRSRGDTEEYAGSEKYEVRHWDLDRPDSLAELVARINHIRRHHPALQRNDTLRFHAVDNPQLIAYSKSSPASEGAGGTDVVLTVVNLDSANPQSGWIDLDLEALGVPRDRPFVVHDLLTEAYYQWQEPRNFVLLDPAAAPAHVFAVVPSDVRPAPRVPA